MTAYIYIHASGEIVEKFVVEFDKLEELSHLCEYARKKYCDVDDFCFDVMIM